MQIQSLDIHKRLATARLPALPQVLLELMALCDRDDVGMAEIGAAVAKDAGIAARIVGIANSPFYRPNRPLENIDQCLAVLGTSIVRRLALNQSVVELFGRFQQARDYDLRYFWFHGLSVAVTARKLAERLAYGNVEEAYLAGLLHDVGQLALLSTEADRYVSMFKSFTGERELMRQEQAAFGLTHAEVGAWLAERWHMHALFVDSILYHHESPERVREAHPLVQIVMLANLFNALSAEEFAVREADLAPWRLTIPEVLELLECAQNEARAIAAELGIELASQPSPVVVPGQSAEAAQAELAEQVCQRMDGMLATPEACGTDAFDDALLDLQRGASLLFGGHDSAVFLPRGDALCRQRSAECEDRGQELSIPCSGSQSRIALAYQGRIGLAGHAAQADNLVDAQVLRQLGGDRLLCLPLVFEGTSLGALAVGLDLPTVEHFARKPSLLATFAREAGRRLGLAAKQRELVAAAREAAGRQHELHVRKLVHEAGNPLGVIRNYLSVLRQVAEDKTQVRDDIGMIEEELRRVGRILQRMREAEPAPGATPAPQPAKVNVNALVSEAVRFWRLGKAELQGIDLAFSPSPDLPPVSTDQDKLKQILTNLVFNAAEAMRGKGRIALATAWWRSGQNQDTLEVTVSDEGPGLPREVLANLYQPVQSAKGEGHAGLGLAIVAALVKELGGSLQCSSGAVGTRFKILLPVSL